MATVQKTIEIVQTVVDRLPNGKWLEFASYEPDDRVSLANDMYNMAVSGELSKTLCKTCAQVFVVEFFKELQLRYVGDCTMSSVSDRLYKGLLGRKYAYGCNAYPLPQDSFEYVIRHCW